VVGKQIDRFLPKPNRARPGLAVAQLEAITPQVAPLQREDLPATAPGESKSVIATACERTL
jgi:hypothetical protein